MIYGLDPKFTSWGPLINHETYVIQPLTHTDLITAIIVILFASSAAYIGYKQTMKARAPWESGYLWMVWLELASSLVIAIECRLFLVRAVRPSFYLFMSILILWTIQTQYLLQIIVSRIRVILHNRRRGQQLMVGTFIAMSVINISVFCIWMPARMQINQRWVHINDVYDRLEKVLYLFIDAFLNIYFIRAVTKNLVSNGLQKYDRLVRFNSVMIVISLLMDLVILGTMSLPNGFVYAIFHPLAYLVKLNIEMSMARLIKKIALSTNALVNPGGFRSFSSSSKEDGSPGDKRSFKSWVANQQASVKDMFRDEKSQNPGSGGIHKTEEFTVRSGPSWNFELESRKGSGNKDLNVAVSCVAIADGHSRAARNAKEEKTTRVKMSDEETLIEPRLECLVHRKSMESSAPPSVASDTR